MKGMHTSRISKQGRPLSTKVTDGQTKAIVLFFVLSLVLHAAAFGAMVFFQDFSFPKPLPPVIKVDLVSFSPELAPEESAAPAVSQTKGISHKKAPPKPKPRKIKHKTADISLKTKPKNLKDLMEQQRKKKKKAPEKIVKKSEEPPPKEAPEPEKKPLEEPAKVVKKEEERDREKIAKALSRLQKKVAEGGPKKGEETTGYTGGRKTFSPKDLYNLVIQSAVTQNWVYSDILAGMDQDLEVTVIIKILKSGQIRDIFFETRSGNRYLDESAKKAIMKSNPLPPLPSGMPHYTLGLIFTPKGLK